MSGHGDAPAIPPRTDLILAAIALTFGIAVMGVSATMPTFTGQGTPIYVAPGLVPGFHGTVIGLLAVVLAARSVSRGALAAGVHAPREGTRRAAFRIALAGILAIIFDIGLVGRIPFWLAAAIFIFVFINAFEWERGQTMRQRSRNAAIGLAIGLVAGIGITLLFERVFLIRMPG